MLRYCVLGLLGLVLYSSEVFSNERFVCPMYSAVALGMFLHLGHCIIQIRMQMRLSA